MASRAAQEPTGRGSTLVRVLALVRSPHCPAVRRGPGVTPLVTHRSIWPLRQVVPYLELAYGNTHTAYGPLCDVGMLQYKLGQADEAYGTLLRALGCQLRALHANAAHLTMQVRRPRMGHRVERGVMGTGVRSLIWLGAGLASGL